MEVIAEVDCLVIGGGVIGMAIARALAQDGREILLVEQGRRFGDQTSARNSGVIHSGIYYPSGSLKARLCIAGRDMLYAYAASRNVAHDRCGKLIVAVSDREAEGLADLARRGAENGVDDLRWLECEEVRALEPDIACAAAVLSPSTGIIDATALIGALEADALAAGAILALNSRFVSAARHDGQILARIDSDGEALVKSRWLINAAGLQAPDLARSIEGIRRENLPNAYYARGSYFSYDGPARFRHLIYPMPEPGGLGIHLTLDIGGQARFGPDVEWIEAVDYRLNETRKPAFVRSIQRYWPALDPERLHPGYTGIRPKIVPQGTEAADFMIQTDVQHGIEGLINLMGIESPGLTSSMAIAEHIRLLVGG